jgi:hypothetical protein
MSVQDFLSRLDKVKSTGKGQWKACCPAHNDKTPSLTIKELEDGTVLAHCFGQECGIDQILGALGLEFDALYPPNNFKDRKGIKRPFSAYDVLEALDHEAMIVAVAASNLAQGIALTDADRARCWTAANRIEQGRRLAHG